MILKRIAEVNKATLTALFKRIQSPFSFIKLKDFSASAQKAVWASAIIREILNAKPISAFDSLQRRIKNLKLPTSISDTDQVIEKEMKMPFIDGIRLDQFFMSHQNRLSNPNSIANFIFCPNYTVTQPMFQYLFSIQDSFFVSGQFGTSKTISVILANILSRPINNFKVDAHKDQQKLKELKFLGQQNLLIYTPKFFYWSIPSTSGQQKQLYSQKTLVKQLKEQLKDLPPAQFQEISKMNDLLDVRSAIVQYYWNRAGIYTKVVIDQINTAASVIREWNNQLLVCLNKAKKLKNQIERQMQNMDKQLIQSDYLEGNKIQEMYKQRLKHLYQQLTLVNNQLESTYLKNKDQKEIANDMINLVNTYRTFGQFVLFNSSVNIEEDILKYSRRRDYPLLGLQILENHFHVDRKHIYYFKALKKQQGRRDFFNFFWFEIESRIQKKPTQQVLEAFEAKFYEIALRIPIRHYSRPFYTYLFIKQEFKDKHKNLLPLIQKLDQQKTKQYFTSLVGEYNTYCLQQSKVKIGNFVKENDQRRELVTIINEFAKSLLNENKQQIVISVEVFYQAFNLSLQKLLLSNNYNKELIPLEYDAAKKEITFHWSPQQFIDITKNIADPYKLYESLMDRYNKQFFKRYPPSEGYYFEYTLVELLKPTVQFTLAILSNKPQGKITKSSPKYKNKPIIIFSVKEFTSFKMQEEDNDKKKKSLQGQPKQVADKKKEDKKRQDDSMDSISNNFSRLLSESFSNPSMTIMGIPYRDKDNKDTYEYRNPTFDFVLMTYDKKKDFYLIRTFDATISRSSLGTKESDARKFLAKLSKDKKGLNFEIQHIILCSSAQCLKRWKENKDKTLELQQKYTQQQLKLVVNYSSYDHLKVKYFPVTQEFARMRFQGFRSFLQQNEKRKQEQKKLRSKQKSTKNVTGPVQTPKQPPKSTD